MHRQDRSGPMEQLATVSYVMQGNVPLVPMPDMKTSSPGGRCCDDGNWVSSSWYSHGYEECTYDPSGYGQGGSEWNAAGHCDYGDAEEPADTEGRRPRRRGGRRRKTKTATQGPLASSASTPTSGTSAPVQVGLQSRARSQAEVAQASVESEAVAEVLRQVETEEGKARVMAKLDSLETRQETLSWMVDAAFFLATSSKFGTEIVQRALEVADAEFRGRLLLQLASKAVELYESPHGNYTLSKAVEVLPSERLSRIVEKLQERGFEEVSKHKFGCRLMERLIEHITEADQRLLIAAIVPKAEALSKHQYGNFVVQHLYEHAPAARADILKALLAQIPQLANHRTASHVIQRSLTYSDERGQAAVVQALLQGRDEASLVNVALGRYGSFVIEQLAQLPPNLVAPVRRTLEAELPTLVSSAFGRRVAEAFEFEFEVPEEFRQEDQSMQQSSMSESGDLPKPVTAMQ